MEERPDRSAHPRAAYPPRQTADLPLGYPLEYQRLVTLRDRRRVLIRPVLPSDAPALAESIESADADTIRRRFLGGRPQVTPGLLAYLTTVDYTSRLALVAVDPASQRGVAIARYEPAERDGAAEIAIAVVPGWRGAGLAGELAISKSCLPSVLVRRKLRDQAREILAVLASAEAVSSAADRIGGTVRSRGESPGADSPMAAALAARSRDSRRREQNSQQAPRSGRAGGRCEQRV